MSSRRIHIVLIGFMGSGKSTIGHLLASKLNRPLIDTDREVVEREKMSISAIFEQKGEKYFRKVEREVLLSALNSEIPAIISTGGGAPCFLDGMDYILRSSISFYLKVGRASLFSRIYGDKERPLVILKTKHELIQFIDLSLRKREAFYTRANKTILAYDNPDKIVERIIKYYNKEHI